MHLPVVIGALLGGIAGREKQQAFFMDTTKWVFIIPLEKRHSKADVEKTANWQCIGTIAQVTARPGQGPRQACQLIVDERDTYSVRINGKAGRKLKTTLLITAQKDNEHWYVNTCSSPQQYACEIHNEENE